VPSSDGFQVSRYRSVLPVKKKAAAEVPWNVRGLADRGRAHPHHHISHWLECLAFWGCLRANSTDVPVDTWHPSGSRSTPLMTPSSSIAKKIGPGTSGYQLALLPTSVGLALNAHSTGSRLERPFERHPCEMQTRTPSALPVG
jgi:hypothetical protein